MKKVAGTLRIDLAQYRELEAFAQFGSELDAETQKRLTQGKQLQEILKQSQYQPLPVEEQIVILFAATRKLLLDILPEDMENFETGLPEYMRNQNPELLEKLTKPVPFSEEMQQELEHAILAFKKQFQGKRKEEK